MRWLDSNPDGEGQSKLLTFDSPEKATTRQQNAKAARQQGSKTLDSALFQAD